MKLSFAECLADNCGNVRLIRSPALANGHGRIALVHSPRFKIFGRNAAHGKDAVRPTGDPRGDARLGANPDAIFQHNGPSDEVEGGVFVVVVAAEEPCSLRDAHVRADGDLSQVVNPHLLADPAVVANGEFPRVLDGHAGLDDDT